MFLQRLKVIKTYCFKLQDDFFCWGTRSGHTLLKEHLIDTEHLTLGCCPDRKLQLSEGKNHGQERGRKRDKKETEIK